METRPRMECSVLARERGQEEIRASILPVRCPTRLGGSRRLSMRDSQTVRRVAGVLAGLALATSLAAQAGERIAYVTVIDEKTRQPVPNLGTDAFVIKEDGARREVLRVTPATTPMPVAI